MSSPAQIGPYRIVRELARGGMGVVYVAEHVQLGRQVALKQMLGDGERDQAAERFAIEAQALARLRHPNIVAVHDVGTSPQGPYFAMEFVPGRTLQALLKEGRPAPRRAAELTLALAQALGHAHQAGILHRDLKPANVLIDPSGRPLLTDFGLARDMSAERERLTRSGQLLGTPAFMAPEQVESGTDDVGPPADVYGLGALLYALLAGEAPFSGASPMNIVAKVLTKPPRRVRALAPECPVDLETIALKCLQKEPAQRYPNMPALAADLERALAGEPIQGQPPRHARRWLAAHRVSLLVVTSGLLLALTAGVVGKRVVSKTQAKSERSETRKASLTEITEGLHTRRRELRRRARLGAAREPLSDLIAAVDSGLSAHARASSDALEDSKGLRSELGSAALTALDVAAQGVDPTALDDALALGERVVARLPPLSAPALERRLGQRDRLRDALATRALKSLADLATRARQTAAKEWLRAFPGHRESAQPADWSMTEPVRTVAVPGQHAVFLDGGDAVVSSEWSYQTQVRPGAPPFMNRFRFRLCDTSSGSLRRPPMGLRLRGVTVGLPYVPMAASGDGRFAALWVPRGVRLLDSQSPPRGELLRVGEHHQLSLHPALNRDGSLIAVGISGPKEGPHRLRIYKAGERAAVHERELDVDPRSLAFLSDHELLIAARRTQSNILRGAPTRSLVNTTTVSRWNFETDETLSSTHGFTHNVTCLATSGGYAALGDGAGFVQLLDLETLEPRNYPPGAELRARTTGEREPGFHRAECIVVSARGTILYALNRAGKDSSQITLRVYDVKSGGLLLERPVGERVWNAGLSADGERLLLFGDGRVRIWNAWPEPTPP